ncbi:MAG: OmpA family protein [Myxococcota bacterium]|nr:OmpA family protein [Myxococcota bacterium]
MSIQRQRAQSVVFTAFLCFLWSVSARGETGDYNLHLEVGPGLGLSGWQADTLGVGISGAARFELAFFNWFGVDIGGGYLQFFKADHPQGYEQIDRAYWYSGSLGVRFRLHNDEQGFLLPWKKTPNHAGNLWGNAWIDLHGNYYNTGDLNRFGADVGIGMAFSFVNGLQVGPFARGAYVYQPNSNNARDAKDGWFLLAGLSFSISIPPGSQTLSDTDMDGIYDPDDTCPEKAEDQDGFEDDDGCPDEDNDLDSILDRDDKCPLTPEDVDGVEDQDGCPDTDNDSDGIQDDKDKCPAEPEDKDGFQDEDGCPDPDNDGDGILDAVDQCPDEAETIDKFEDEDGCPESDRDEDGFADVRDICPDEPETVNGVEDDDGCPDEALVEVKEDKILLGERLFFDFAMTRIKTRSRKILKQLANLIKTHPEYLVISIEGHADTKGASEFNLRLSERRARRVRKYLIDLGVEPNRLIIVGYGESQPWVDPNTVDKRFKNRRVELVIKEIDEELAKNPMAKETKEAVQKKAKPKAPLAKDPPSTEKKAGDEPTKPKVTEPPQSNTPAEKETGFNVEDSPYD